jgi:Zn-dependent protease with chaperone function
MAALIYGVSQFVNGDVVTTDLGAWLLVGGFSSLGDWSLAVLNLGFYGEIWATVPFGIFLGLALLLFTLAQAGLTDLLMGFAIRVAQRRG